ncbi:cAMP-specific 3',5'-cyclic phosphodiesterase 4B-like isoform X2 [Spodoptera litura]|uniref:Phosphodiesterase n=1 Tax=Spodoptera litura TaxID=69820 RepID=A0A9J7IXX1_SPOLT|nr:cAMP-specific 3',5'-cyclic phosphodiesterase 4B-like isoform X2 [Spodoptera litura]
MQRCGFCSVLSGLLRRAMCVGSRRGSSESYYRELGDQDTLKIEDKSSDLSDDAEEETSLCHGNHDSPRASPRSSPRVTPHTSPRVTPHTSPGTSPRSSRRTSPRTSSRTSRRDSPRTSPRPSRRASPKTSPRSSRRTSPRTSPRPFWRTSPRMYSRAFRWTSPRISPQSSPRTSPRMSRRTSRFSQSDIHPDSLEEKVHGSNNTPQKNLSAGRFLTMHKRRKKRLITRSLYIEKALLDDLSLGQVQCILNNSYKWKFNAFTLENVSGGRCLPVLCVHLFQMYGLLNHFNLDAAKAWKLFSLIEEGYHSTNPYHNSIHAADVTQAMHCFLQQKRIRDHLTPLEIMGSLLAAIAHDLDHPGVNQPFLIATSNHLAALYQNTSVLENHHWRSAMSCLIESGLLDQLPSSHGLRATLEKQISSLILATDITRQQEYLNHFKNHLDMNTLDMRKQEHRHLVLQIALKCADISNPCRPWEISRKWSLKVCEEFFRQGDYERKLNLPVTALCDRHTTSIPKIQTGFFKFVVTPLISEWHRFLQNDLSSQMLNNLLFNQQKWETLVLEEQAQETRTEISDADAADDDLDTGSDTNMSDSSELLLPPRRCSLNPVRHNAFKEQLRRFSVPLNVFQDSKFKNREREKSRASSLAEPRPRCSRSPAPSEPSLHSQLSVRGHCEHQQEPTERVLSSEKLLPDSSIASITTPVQATRLNTVLKEGGSWKLVRQQTFPPLESTSREHSLASRPIHTSNEDSIFLTRVRPDFLQFDQGPSQRDSKGHQLVVRDIKKTDTEESSESSAEASEPPRLQKENSEPQKPSKKESTTVGSQLRDNLASMPLPPLESDPLLQRRRKSMPADVFPFTPKERKVREVPPVFPQFVHRTFSEKESWTRRRGSAPLPVAPSELRGLASLGSPRHSVNGGRRKPSPIVSCQQWLAKATLSIQERRLQKFPRRSSLPVEVMTGVSSY